MNEFNNSYLIFDRLNDNDAGIVFSLLDEAGIDDIKDLSAVWANEACGLTPKATITEWSVIELKSGIIKGHSLVGYKEGYDCRVTTTSLIYAMAPDLSALITENGSLYQLRLKRIEPDSLKLSAFIATMHDWGVGVDVRDWPEIIG